ncbi:MAG: TIM barrel protein [Acidobacteriota bacterium]
MIRLANAPCSWGVLEFDCDQASAPYGQVLDEIRDTGYAGTELGDWGFMPTDPAQLRDAIAARQLALIGAFVPVPLAEADTHAEGARTAVRTARLLRDAGADSAFIVLSDDNGRVPAREQRAGLITPADGLTAEAWTTFAAGAEAVARAVSNETGLRTVFHPHCGGYVETPEEIDALLSRTPADLLGLCLDTGHLAYGGGHPVALHERYASRVWHVHFKDCHPGVAASARRQGVGYLAAVRARLFCELGQGAVDFPSVIAALRRNAYDGWVVVEQDVFAGQGTPADSARRNRAYLATLGL